MSDTMCPSTAPRRRSILAIWLGRLFRHRRAATARLDPEALPPALLRDIGLMDGRGPSLRRPERCG